MSDSIHINDISFYREGDSGLVWKDIDGGHPLPSPGGGGREAAFLIEFLVDGDYTIVYHQGGDRVVLEKVIADLTALVAELDAVYPADQSRGKCLTYDDQGELCYRRDGHDDEHRFINTTRRPAT